MTNTQQELCFYATASMYHLVCPKPVEPLVVHETPRAND